MKKIFTYLKNIKIAFLEFLYETKIGIVKIESKFIMNQFEDREIACVDCGASFPFSAEDQEFFSTKGYSEPKRCPSCRAARKANSSRGGGGGRSGGGRGGYGNSRPQYRVVCSGCGCETTVPFEPKGDRPVYCSDCYRNG